MSRTLTYGMVGGGPGAFIGDAHRRAIALDGSARLVAAASPAVRRRAGPRGRPWGWTRSGAIPTTRRWPARRAPGRMASTLVVVVTPNVTHYEICKAFLEAGIHVACDKPLAVDSAQGEELARLAGRRACCSW